ncbi:MAG: dihydrolipoamide acetyltransferase family protein [Thermodesulfobacteriota bacterium]
MAVTVFKMPQLSLTMLEGEIVKWLKQEGDAVNEGEPLLEVESDKVVVEITAPVSGYLRKVLVQEGNLVPPDAPICLIAGQEDDLTADLEGLAGDIAGLDETTEKAEGSLESEIERQKPLKPRISPLARKVALELSVDFQGLTGTGPGGLIVKTDVKKALTTKEAASAPVEIQKDTTVETEIIPIRGIRKMIAEHLTMSKQSAADVTTVAEVDMTKVSAYRAVLPVSYTAFVVRAAAKALREFPILNSSLIGEEIHVKKQINVCVAVATQTGLLTPVIRETDKKNILSIAEEIQELSVKAKDGILEPADFSDGTFTVTNSGVFGSLFFTPIINYPQCAVLGAGKVMKSAVVREDQIVIAPMMYLCLTYDHRIVDGAPAVKFLQKVKYYLEYPGEMILSQSD